jgi:2'-5' RNA ligase
MRLFIAIDLSEKQKQQVHSLQQRLSGFLDGVKWAPPHGMHLTLQFLGEVKEERVPETVQAMEETAVSAAPFNLRFGKAGVFPVPHRARVLWVGLLDGSSQVEEIASTLEKALLRHGFTIEQREYRPHLTLGRLRYPLPRAKIAQYLEQELHFTTEPATVGGIALYRSELFRQGAVYTALRRIFFG